MNVTEGGKLSTKQNRLFYFAIFAILLTFSISGCAGVVQPQQTPPAGPQASVVPSSISFTNVIVGQKSTQSIQISNSGKANLNVTGISLTGTGFSLSTVAVPFQLTPGANKSFTVTFSASNTSTAKATLTITSDDPSSPLTVAIQGTGENAAAAWQMTPASLSFPATALQATSSLSETVKNTGNVSVTISSITLSSAVWTTSGISTGTTLAPGQQVAFQVTFRPTAAGNVTGSLKLASSSAGASALTAQLAGSGATATTKQHAATLNWNASTSVIAGYRIYRGATSGGPYSLLNSTIDSSTSYVDSSVVSGTQYFYVTTAVDNSGGESSYSNEISVKIPTP